jgi:hypothetical protein
MDSLGSLLRTVVFPLGVELSQPLSGLTEVAQTGVSIDRLKPERIVQSAADHIEDRFLGGSNRLLAVAHDQ